MSNELKSSFSFFTFIAVFSAFSVFLGFDAGRTTGRREGRAEQDAEDRQYPGRVMECDAVLHKSEPCVFTPGVVGTRYCVSGRWHKCELEKETYGP